MQVTKLVMETTDIFFIQFEGIAAGFNVNIGGQLITIKLQVNFQILALNRRQFII